MNSEGKFPFSIKDGRQMQKNEIKEEGLKKVRKIIYGRTLVVAAAFLIQFALLLGGFIFLSDYSFALYGFFLIISASVVIYLYNARGIPDFKLVWMLPIIVLPVVGALLYLYFTLQPGTRLIYKRLTDLSEETGKYVIQNPEVKKRLRSTDPQTAHLADYLSEYADAPVYDHTSVKYYSLGDYQYKDILSELKKAERFIFLEFFIVAEGEMWESILDILKAKAKEGVEVRVMYDGTCVLSLLPYFYPEILRSWKKKGSPAKCSLPSNRCFPPTIITETTERYWLSTEKPPLPEERTWQMNILTESSGSATGRIRR